jgi:hypothetical protein
VSSYHANSRIFHQNNGINAYKEEATMKILLYAGLDVRKETIDVVVYRENELLVISSGGFRIGKVRYGRYSEG